MHCAGRYSSLQAVEEKRKRILVLRAVNNRPFARLRLNSAGKK